MRVAIYARVSSRVKCLGCRASFNGNGLDCCPKCRSPQLEKRQDADNQVATLTVTAWARHNEHDIAAIYADEATGSRADREQFQQLFCDAAEKRFELVIFWSLDRFSREGVLPTLKHLEKLTALGIAWKSYTEQYLDSAGIFKDAIISIMATLAKQERLRISERTKAGLHGDRPGYSRKGNKLGRREQLHLNRETIVLARARGITYRELAAEFGISRVYAHEICTRR